MDELQDNDWERWEYEVFSEQWWEQQDKDMNWINEWEEDDVARE